MSCCAHGKIDSCVPFATPHCTVENGWGSRKLGVRAATGWPCKVFKAYLLAHATNTGQCLTKIKAWERMTIQIRMTFTATTCIMFLILLFLLYYIASDYENWNCFSSLLTEVLTDLWRGRHTIICTMNFMPRWMRGHFSLISLFYWQDWIARCAPQKSVALNLDYILWDHHREIQLPFKPTQTDSRIYANNMNITEPNISIAITVRHISPDTCKNIK